MYRNILLAGALALCTSALAGCYIYADDDYDDGYSYCDDTGCYWCDDWGCYPDGSGGDGWTCASNYDCAAGCYCDEYGYCQENGGILPGCVKNLALEGERAHLAQRP